MNIKVAAFTVSKKSSNIYSLKIVLIRNTSTLPLFHNLPHPVNVLRCFYKGSHMSAPLVADIEDLT